MGNELVPSTHIRYTFAEGRQIHICNMILQTFIRLLTAKNYTNACVCGEAEQALLCTKTVLRSMGNELVPSTHIRYTFAEGRQIHICNMILQTFIRLLTAKNYTNACVCGEAEQALLCTKTSDNSFNSVLFRINSLTTSDENS